MTLIQNARIFNGSKAPSFIGDIRLEDGRISEISKQPLKPREFEERVDATGLWAMPGFIDFHTHYDAEIEVSPELQESVRHGVTTVTLGSCSLSLSLGDPVDLADMFSRVEAIPRKSVLEILQSRKKWNSAEQYRNHLNDLPLGPNVTSFAGHSAIRTHVLGLERALTRGTKVSREELGSMKRLWITASLACRLTPLYGIRWTAVAFALDRFRRPLLPGANINFSTARCGAAARSFRAFRMFRRR